MTNTAIKTYLVGVIERAIAYYEVEAEDARTAAENWQEGDYHDRDDETLECEGPCNVRVRQPDGAWIKLPRSEWDAPSNALPVIPAEAHSDGQAVTVELTGVKPFSVLLLYPDYANDSGTETFYAFVQATDAIAAVSQAQRQAVAAQEGAEAEPEDFAALLVTQGHHASEPLFNR